VRVQVGFVGVGLGLLGLVALACATPAAQPAPSPIAAAATATWTPEPWKLTATAETAGAVRMAVVATDQAGTIVAATQTMLAADMATSIVLLAAATEQAKATATPHVPAPMQTAVAAIGNIRADTPPQYIDPRDLAADPIGNAGKNVFLQGKVLTVTQREGYTWLQLMAQPRGRTTTESVSVMLMNPGQTVRRDECYRVGGITAGSDTVTLALTGVPRSVPLLIGLGAVATPAGASGIGCVSP